MNTKGFTLIEMIFAIMIIGIITAISINSFQNAQLKKQQKAIVESIISYIDKAKADTQAGKGGTQHGIKFNENEFVLFSGSNFNPNDSSNRVISIDPRFNIETKLTNQDKTLFFYRLFGTANEPTEITIKHIDDRIPPVSFSVDDMGSVSMIE